jgi:hypothetical protein
MIGCACAVGSSSLRYDMTAIKIAHLCFGFILILFF